MFCNLCGHENPDGSLYCARCGARMEPQAEGGDSTVGLPPVESEVEEEVEVSPPAEALKSGTAIMVIRKGPDAGMTFTLDHDLVSIGRHPESDIFLDDITVSRKHAEIRREGSSFTLTDTGSAPISTGSASNPPCSRTATRYRSASTGCSSSWLRTDLGGSRFTVFEAGVREGEERPGSPRMAVWS